jgi:protein SCO1/2
VKKKGHLGIILTTVLAVGTPAIVYASKLDEAGQPKPMPATPSDVIREVGFDQNLNAQLPLEAKFRNEAGNPVELRQYFGKRPVVLALVYYDCPMLCTLILNGLTSSLKVVNLDAGTDFDVLAVSFDPRETAELALAKKAEYVKEYGRPGAERGWHFLTGDAESIRQLTQAVGFKYFWDEESKQFAHASGVMVVTPDGKLSKYYYGIEYAPRDVKLGLVDASAGRIGSAVDRMLLYCYHYDPVTGRYSLAVMNLIRLLGVGTVAAIALFIVLMLRRERRGVGNALPSSPAAG